MINRELSWTLMTFTMTLASIINDSRQKLWQTMNSQAASPAQAHHQSRIWRQILEQDALVTKKIKTIWTLAVTIRSLWERRKVTNHRTREDVQTHEAELKLTDEFLTLAERGTAVHQEVCDLVKLLISELACSLLVCAIEFWTNLRLFFLSGLNVIPRKSRSRTSLQSSNHVHHKSRQIKLLFHETNLKWFYSDYRKYSNACNSQTNRIFCT